ncbi:sigma 54-interacting transcriptional regulator [Desulfococcus sp.]|uniref:sigma 54-interacting transcriptional regulator n=1 Tax=Desulfococcus sp. TaxID=2025834 RepID=UPI0035937DFE
MKIDEKDVVEFSSNGVLVTDEKGRILLINRQSKKILNLDAKRHIGRLVSDTLPLVGDRILECLKTRRPILGAQISGKQVSLVLNVTPVIKDGMLCGAVSNFQELSAFENSARNLESYKRLNRQLETIIHASSDGIWVCDEKGEIIHVNEASEKLNGIQAADVVGKTVRNLVDTQLFDQSVTLKVLESRQQESLVQFIPRTGRHLLVTGTPAFDEYGNIFLVVVNERDMTELNTLREKIEQTRKISQKYREELTDLSMLELKRHDIVAESDKMRQVLHMAMKLSRIDDANILILGESGTGKGLLAKFIHKSSSRCKNPFVQINCAALPEQLLEAELFGYEKGAFSGAGEKGKVGLFEVAHTGTVFLDEIGDMPPSLQAKLLTYLDNHEIRRLGGTESFVVNCAVIAATNQDIEGMVKEKRFRKDLYFRLNSFILQIPPLRERPEDIFELVQFYLEKYNREYNTRKRIRPSGLDTLLDHAFPGNVRELKSIIKKAVVMSDRETIDPVVMSSIDKSAKENSRGRENALSSRIRLPDRVAAVEKEILARAMKACRSTREMAGLLGISQSTVVRRMKRHRLAFDKIHS